MNYYHRVLNSERMKWRRKDLRRSSTEIEKLLWNELRNSKLGFKFKRQYSVMNFVLDFYCAGAKLAVELDGRVHKSDSQQKYDQYRTAYLSSLGVREIRFDNDRVESELARVVMEIKNLLPSPEVRRGIEGEVKK